MTNSAVAEQLPLEAQALCTQAIYILHQLCWKVVESRITLNDLHEVSKLEKNIEDTMQQFLRIPFKEGSFPEWEKFKTSLQRRIKEYQNFEQRRKQLFLLTVYCHELAPGEWEIAQ